jgi:hypothetical protein
VEELAALPLGRWVCPVILRARGARSVFSSARTTSTPSTRQTAGATGPSPAANRPLTSSAAEVAQTIAAWGEPMERAGIAAAQAGQEQ